MNVDSTIIHNCSKLGVMKQPSVGTWIHLLVWFIHSMEYYLVIGEMRYKDMKRCSNLKLDD